MPQARTRKAKAATAPAAPEVADETGGKTDAEAPALEGRAAVLALGPKAISVLETIMDHGTSEAARIAAANAVLDRAYGKASTRSGGGEAAEGPVETRLTVRFV